MVLTSTGGTSLGNPIIYTVTVTGTAGATAPSDANGGITWHESGTGAVASTTCTTSTANSTVGAVTTYTCTLTPSAIAPAGYGSFVMTAHYNGDINFNATDSNQVTVGINTLTPSFFIPASNPNNPGNPITFDVANLGGTTTLSVTLVGSTYTPAGAMTWNVKSPNLMIF